MVFDDTEHDADHKLTLAGAYLLFFRLFRDLLQFGDGHHHSKRMLNIFRSEKGGLFNQRKSIF